LVSYPTQLFPHVLLLQFLNRFPMQAEFASDILDGRGSAPPPNQPRKAFGIKWIIRQPSQSFTFYFAATPAVHPAHEHLQINAMLTTRQVSHQAKLLIVKAAVPTPTDSTGRFFWRRRNVSTRTSGSPKTPRTVAAGTNPANR